MTQSQEFQEKFEDLRASFLAKLPQKLDTVDTAWSMLNNVNWDKHQLGNLHRIVHSISGTSATFHMEALAQTAARLDKALGALIENNQIPNNASKTNIEQLIQQLYEHSGIVSDLPEVSDIPVSAWIKVLIVDDDEEQARYLELLCQEMGCITTTLSSPKEVADEVRREVPDLILMDVVFPEGPLAGVDAIRDIYRKIGFKIPVVFASARNDLSSRVKAYRAGGLGYLHKPVKASELKVQLELLSNHQDFHARILVIDDDPDFIEMVSDMLESQGFYVVGSSRPTEILHMLERHRPDLLIMDVNMPQIKGDELLTVLRQEVKYAKLPTLLVTGDTSPHTVSFLMTHGANGVIHKPLEFNVLLDSIHSVLKSSKSRDAILENVTKKDTISQSVQRQYFFSRIEQGIGLSSKQAPQVLASISFKNHENIRRQIGISHIDELTNQLIKAIRQDLYESEYITQISELHFALILTNTSSASLDNRLEKLVERISHLDPKQRGFAVHLHPCLSAIHLNANIASVDEALSLVEAQMMQIIKSKDTVIGIQQATQLAPPTDSELRETVAVALRKGALHLNYQPIIDVSGKERIFEGLARMQDENQALILPDDFISKIRELKMQTDFNKLIVKTCIQEIKKLHGREAQETEIIVKLLLSHQPMLSFLTWVSNNLQASKLRGTNRLIFSVTQSDLTQYFEQIVTLRNGMKNLSCGLMVEQVGREVALNENFLTLIDDLEIRYLRLDPLMTRAILKQDEEALDILRQLQARSIPIIATHVEDNTMFSDLWELGIRYFQGYFVKRPDETLNFDFKIENTVLK